jgi:hypothetical protein
MKSAADLSLPASVETFDSGLKTGISGGAKTGGDAQLKHRRITLHQSVTELVSALETECRGRIGVSWQAKNFPQCSNHRLDWIVRAKIWRLGQDPIRTSVQRYGV